MNTRFLARPAVWSCFALGQLAIVYTGGALGAFAPTPNFGFGRLLANPSMGLLYAGLALVILGLACRRGQQSSAWKIAANVTAGSIAAVSLYLWVTFFGGTEFPLLMASALLSRDYVQRT